MSDVTRLKLKASADLSCSQLLPQPLFPCSHNPCSLALTTLAPLPSILTAILAVNPCFQPLLSALALNPCSRPLLSTLAVNPSSQPFLSNLAHNPSSPLCVSISASSDTLPSSSPYALLAPLLSLASSQFNLERTQKKVSDKAAILSVRVYTNACDQARLAWLKLLWCLLSLL
jgi:hypothetical protein